MEKKKKPNHKPEPEKSDTPKIDRTVDNDIRKKMNTLNSSLSEGIQGLPVLGVNEAGEQDFTIKLYSTGILTLDKALNGGLPCGRITELFGEEQGGKSLISMVAAG